MDGWEYMTFDLSEPKKDLDGLDQLGADGWEDVAMVTTLGGR